MFVKLREGTQLQGFIPHPSPGGGFQPRNRTNQTRTSTTLGRRFSKDLPSNGVAAGLLLSDVFWLKKGWKVRDDTRILPSRYIYIYSASWVSNSEVFMFVLIFFLSAYQLCSEQTISHHHGGSCQCWPLPFGSVTRPELWTCRQKAEPTMISVEKKLKDNQDNQIANNLACKILVRLSHQTTFSKLSILVCVLERSPHLNSSVRSTTLDNGGWVGWMCQLTIPCVSTGFLRYPYGYRNPRTFFT